MEPNTISEFLEWLSRRMSAAEGKNREIDVKLNTLEGLSNKIYTKIFGDAGEKSHLKEVVEKLRNEIRQLKAEISSMNSYIDVKINELQSEKDKHYTCFEGYPKTELGELSIEDVEKIRSSVKSCELTFISEYEKSVEANRKDKIYTIYGTCRSHTWPVMAFKDYSHADIMKNELNQIAGKVEPGEGYSRRVERAVSELDPYAFCEGGLGVFYTIKSITVRE